MGCGETAPDTADVPVALKVPLPGPLQGSKAPRNLRAIRSIFTMTEQRVADKEELMFTRPHFWIFCQRSTTASFDHTAHDLIIHNLNQLTCYIPHSLHPFSPSSPLSSPPPPRPRLLITIMPSLRRTSSHPTLRSSPYGPTQRTQHPYPHRRSSGPETSRRRVLADIDWWTVSDGQVPASTALQTQTAAATPQEQDENVHVEAPVLDRTQPDPPTVEDVEESVSLEDSPVVHTRISVSRCPRSSVARALGLTSLQFSSRAAGYAALSVAPRPAPLAARRHTAPTSFYRNLGTSLSLSTDFEDHSPISSLTSSPEPSPLPLTPTTTPTFNFSFSDDCFSGLSTFETPSTPPRLNDDLPEPRIDYDDEIIPCNPAFSQVLDSSFTQFINDGFLF